MDDDLHVLTLPYNNDLYTVYNKTNNIRIIVVLVIQLILQVSCSLFFWFLIFFSKFVPIFL